MHSQKLSNSLDQAIDIAMEKLEQKMPKQSIPASPYSFANRNKPCGSEFFKYEIDLESQTLEDILESKTQDSVQSQHQSESQRKIEYLQQKVSELVGSLQLKLQELSILQYQVQQISEAQQEIRQLLNGLLPHNSP
jgi:hypothetical protein